jgi:hypothetical protein
VCYKKTKVSKKRVEERIDTVYIPKTQQELRLGNPDGACFNFGRLEAKMFSQLTAVLNQATQALQIPAQVVQTPHDTINKLAQRLKEGANREDRRAALLGLKGLARGYKEVS